MIIRILLLPSLDVVLLVLQCFLAYLVLMPLMSGNAPADGPEAGLAKFRAHVMLINNLEDLRIRRR